MPRNLKKEKRSKGPSALEAVIIIVILLVVGWAVWSFSQPPPTPTATTTGPSTAPDFTLPQIEPNGQTGQPITLSSFRGKVVLLEFMEPWCPHCQHMAPVIDGLYKQYGSNVVFITVSGNWQGASAQDTAKFQQDYGTTWIYVYDGSGTVFSEYGISSTPTFFVIGKNGSVFSTYQGELSADTLATDLTRAQAS